jgi:hypothetical protein
MLETDPTRYVLLLAVLGGIGLFLDQTIYLSLGEDFSTRIVILVGVLVGGAIVGVLALYVYGFLLKLAGRAVGGVGTAADCRTAFAWSNIPAAWLVPVYSCTALVVLFIGSETLLSDMFEELEAGTEFSMELLPMWLKLISAMAVITRLWQIVLTCQSIGEAHQVSSGKGLLALILANFILMGLVVVVAISLQLSLSLKWI